MSIEIIDLREIAPKPWKNGAGLTREIAAEPADASLDDFDWRISVAEIARDAPFSAFADVDRCIVLLQGRGVHLRSDDGVVDACLDKPFDPFHFAGDKPMTATLIDGPCADFNVMVRKSRWRADVSEATGTHRVEATSASLVFCAQGRLSIDAGEDEQMALHEGQATLWRHGAPGCTIQAQMAGTRYLTVQLHALCPDAKP